MTAWINAPLVALDLEGSGAQDRDDEAILEIAIVPIRDGQPFLARHYTTLINPGRPIPRRPWISPGLTSKVLATAPTLPRSPPNSPSASTARSSSATTSAWTTGSYAVTAQPSSPTPSSTPCGSPGT